LLKKLLLYLVAYLHIQLYSSNYRQRDTIREASNQQTSGLTNVNTRKHQQNQKQSVTSVANKINVLSIRQLIKFICSCAGDCATFRVNFK